VKDLHGPQPGVFLDRDGVLNEAVVRDGKPHPPEGLAGFQLLPGVVDACERLHGAGFVLVVVTNQPDIARGTQDRRVVDQMHELLRRALPIDAIYLCVHDDVDGCTCRKPAPGMLLTAARDLDLDLGLSVMVGDRWRDIEAGRRAGCRTVFVDRGYSERPPVDPDTVVDDLVAAADWITSDDASWRCPVTGEPPSAKSQGAPGRRD
jgi:D-glycero-D-manno-heptose 1,7-bisphosphate phosphatase